MGPSEVVGPGAAGGVVYTYDNTLPRSLLVARGWTAGHITRLLGAPDLLLASGLGQPTYRWGLERIQGAEAGDEKLRRRRELFYARREQERSAGVAQALQEGRVIFRRVQGEWVIQGRDLAVGQVVTVTHQDGGASQVVVEEVMAGGVDADGVCLAWFTRLPEAAPTLPAPAAQHTAQEAPVPGPATP